MLKKPSQFIRGMLEDSSFSVAHSFVQCVFNQAVTSFDIEIAKSDKKDFAAENNEVIYHVFNIAQFLANVKLSNLSDSLEDYLAQHAELDEAVSVKLKAILEELKIDPKKVEQKEELVKAMIEAIALQLGEQLKVKSKEHFNELVDSFLEKAKGFEFPEGTHLAKNEFQTWGNKLPPKENILALQAVKVEVAGVPANPKFGGKGLLVALLAGMKSVDGVVTSVDAPAKPDKHLALVAGEVGAGHADVSAEPKIRIKFSARSLTKPILTIAASIALLGAVVWHFISIPFKSTEKPSAKAIPEVVAKPKPAPKPEPKNKVEVAKPVTPAAAVATQVIPANIVQPEGEDLTPPKKPEPKPAPANVAKELPKPELTAKYDVDTGKISVNGAEGVDVNVFVGNALGKLKEAIKGKNRTKEQREEDVQKVLEDFYLAMEALKLADLSIMAQTAESQAQELFLGLQK